MDTMFFIFFIFFFFAVHIYQLINTLINGYIYRIMKVHYHAKQVTLEWCSRRLTVR
jgi:hypothetical protein